MPITVTYITTTLNRRNASTCMTQTQPIPKSLKPIRENKDLSLRLKNF